MINGQTYADPILGRHSTTPVYKGGNKAVDLILAIDKPLSTYPATDNIVEMMTGVDDPDNIRNLLTWNNQQHATLRCATYLTIDTVDKSAACNPWSTDVPV